jgi:deoxyribonuclease-4
MINEFVNTIGFNYLYGVHLNDSKMPLGSRRDRHANIGKGLIDPSFWTRFMNDPRFDNMPIILETPGGIAKWYGEIEHLYDLINSNEKE